MPLGGTARAWSASASWPSPELFLKTQRQPPSARPAAAALERELEMAVAILHRAGRRLASERNRKPNMLSQAQRTAILELSAKGVTKREIARVLQLSRPTVRKVLRSNSNQVPEIQRAEKAEPYRQQILDLLVSCKGNLVRVHEELTAGGAALSYPALTAFCRKQGIGQTPLAPVGQYHFEPGVEMQHDTSPHEVEVGGRKYKAQTASAVLCYSRMLFFQINPTFQRFDCKTFLTDALQYMGGAVERVMIDNTHVVVLRGTGREMIPVPEMEAFAERFGFRFVAHQIGDANRSARVERPFFFIENNFLAGRTFASWGDLNQQARQWCDRVNSTYKKREPERQAKKGISDRRLCYAVREAETDSAGRAVSEGGGHVGETGSPGRLGGRHGICPEDHASQERAATKMPRPAGSVAATAVKGSRSPKRAEEMAGLSSGDPILSQELNTEDKRILNYGRWKSGNPKTGFPLSPPPDRLRQQGRKPIIEDRRSSLAEKVLCFAIQDHLTIGNCSARIIGNPQNVPLQGSPA